MIFKRATHRQGFIFLPVPIESRVMFFYEGEGLDSHADIVIAPSMRESMLSGKVTAVIRGPVFRIP